MKTLRKALIEAGVKENGRRGSVFNFAGLTGVMNPWAIYNKDIQEAVREKVGGDFYILPSSTEEVLCVPKAGLGIDFLMETVREINHDLVNGQGVYLADDVYEIKGRTIVSAVR